MQEQSILSRQGTEFQSGDQVHFHESKLKPYEQIEAMRLIDEVFADITIEDEVVEKSEAMSPENQAEVSLPSRERIERIGGNLAVTRALVKTDFELAA